MIIPVHHGPVAVVFAYSLAVRFIAAVHIAGMYTAVFEFMSSLILSG